MDKIDLFLRELDLKYGLLEIQEPWYYGINNEDLTKPKLHQKGLPWK